MACRRQFFFISTDVYATVLVVDANIKAWAAHPFYLVEIPKETPNFEKFFPDVRDFRNRLVQADGFPDIAIPDAAVLVPVRMATCLFRNFNEKTSSKT
jgi:hypothetical protein